MQKHTFALSRFGKFMSRQPAELLEFSSSGVALLSGGKALRSFEWAAIASLRLQHNRGGFSLFGEMVAGSLFSRNDATFRIVTGEETLDLQLERDALFRRSDLCRLLSDLYAAGIAVTEQFSDGRSTFLLEPADGETIRRGKENLRSQGLTK